MIPLLIPAPPMFERAMGYMGNRAQIILFWDFLFEEPVVEDGTEVQGGNSRSWQAFMSHPLIRDCLELYNFGSNTVDADYCLVLDRRHRRFSLAEIEKGYLHINSSTQNYYRSSCISQRDRIDTPIAVRGNRDESPLDAPLLSLAAIDQILSACRGPELAMTAWLNEQRWNATCVDTTDCHL